MPRRNLLWLPFFIVAFVCALAHAKDVPSSFILGADISWVQEQEDQGTRFFDDGQQKDILVILKDHGFNWIRLRVFVNPQAPKGYSSRGYCEP